jgi:hypothetical protein
MKRPLLILFALGGGVFAQTTAVTKNPNTNQITGNLVMGANRVLQFDPSSFLSLGGVMRTFVYVDANGAPRDLDGEKVQINNSGIIFGSVDGMLVATSNGSSATEKAFEIQSNGNANFQITWSGFAKSRDKPLCRFHGRLPSAPTGTFGTDFTTGDLYFNTADSKFYCHDGISWKAM